jgi:hypothetical protein
MEQFTVYPIENNNDFEKGKPVTVYEAREEKGKTRLLVGTKNGDIKWFDGSLFKEHQRQVLP